LNQPERQQVPDIICSERFIDFSPTAIVAGLLGEGRDPCSERTIYGLLSKQRLVRERRAKLGHPKYEKPQLLATAPKRLWSWDITKLLGPTSWTDYYVCVILHIFSRYPVGWMLAERENAALTGRLIDETCGRHGIRGGQLVLHADRRAPMTARNTAQLLADLGVVRSLSCPHVSDDDPLSEAHFKTLNYHGEFPTRFASYPLAYAFCRKFFPWYNCEHRHSSLALLTLHDVHFGHDPGIVAARQRVLDVALLAHPDRFARRRPVHHHPPQEVWINLPPPARDATAERAH
jgi:putative transposase